MNLRRVLYQGKRTLRGFRPLCCHLPCLECEACRSIHTQAAQKNNRIFSAPIGVGIHIRRQLIMLSTSEGKMISISITGDNTVADLFPSLLQPTAIAIDWLADRVYIASRNRVTVASSEALPLLCGKTWGYFHRDLHDVSSCVCVCVYRTELTMEPVLPGGGGGEPQNRENNRSNPCCQNGKYVFLLV